MRRPWFALLTLVLAMAARPLGAQPVRWDFEGAEPSWHAAGGDMEFRLDAHQRVAGGAGQGGMCEQVRLEAGNGSYVYLAHEIGAARIIQELRASVWVKSDRPGLQLLARVVLPRTLDQRSGKPVTALLRGTSYNRPGAWQQLHLVDLPKLLEREAVLLRTRLGPNVETAEAYLDQVLLNIYGGPGVTQVWIDDLEIEGFVGQRLDQPAASGRARPSGLAAWTSSGSKVSAELSKPQLVEMNGSLLQVDGRPFFPRLIQYQGEPLKFLKELGFNGIKLADFPMSALLAEAQQEGMWVVSPPPRTGNGSHVAIPDLPGLHRILAWDLGQGLASRDLPAARELSEALRAVDREHLRPITADIDDELKSFGRSVDLLRASRYPLFSSLELGDYGQWLRERPQAARPGTQLWTSIQTQPLPVMVEQLNALARLAEPPGGAPQRTAAIVPTATPEQLRMLVLTAVSQGVKGLCFESYSRLDSADAATRMRAAALELVNQELDLIEPWCSAGSVVAAVTGSDPEIRGMVLQTDRTRLMIPIWSSRHSQCTPAQSSGNNIVFTIPGVPETCDAYEIHPAGLRTLRHKQRRVTGGMRVTLEEFGPTSLVLLTQDPLVVNSATKKLQRTGHRATQLHRDLAASRLEQVAAIEVQLSGRAPDVPEASTWLASAREQLAQTDAQLKVGNLPLAYVHSQRSLRATRMVERAHWDKANAAAGSLVATADATSFGALPQFWASMARLRTFERSLNLLAGGDFEDLDRLVQLGWRHYQHPQPHLESEAQLLQHEPHSGRNCLQLRAGRVDAQGAAGGIVETAPIWIRSAPVDAAAGDVLRIHGWAQVPGPITGSVDGLLIIDSIAGPAMAERIGPTGGWREFTLYRVATQPGQLTLTFALTGLGVARLDDITIERLSPPGQSDRAHPRAAPENQASYPIKRLPPVR